MIYIGTSGFSYDDWKGRFYPEHIAKKNMLSYYAAKFKAVEINSTYYAIPPANTFATMDAKTPDDFRFAVKAHKNMTHASDESNESFLAFLKSIQPLRDSGKFGCMLAQFPWSFKPTSESIGRLRKFRERVGDLPTVIEFRNSAWISEDMFALLRELGLGFCSVDEPRLNGLMPPFAVVTSAIGYVRFHGRNATKWFKHDQAYERYDYLYSDEELSEWIPKIKYIEDKTAQTYVFFNNHYKGKSVQNAVTLAKMLDLSIPPEPPLSFESGQLAFDVGL